MLCSLIALCTALYTASYEHTTHHAPAQELEDHLIGVLTPFSLEVLRGGGGNGGGYLEVRPQGQLDGSSATVATPYAYYYSGTLCSNIMHTRDAHLCI
eukprot:1638-Heterococcus_DN1.PRE.1